MPPRRSRILNAALPLASLAGGALLSAQPFAAAEDRRRAVGDWLVEHVGEEGGGRLVRMTREGDDHAIEYRIGYWRGNPGPVLGGTVMRLNGLCGGYESPSDGAVAAPAAVRAELAGHLAQCGVSDDAAATTLEGFERAYALVSAWAEEAAAVSAAEAQAVADYGMDMGMDANMTDMDAPDMSSNDIETTDTNPSVEPESAQGRGQAMVL